MRSALVAAVLLAAAAPAATQDKEVNEVNGRSFEDWLKDCSNKDPSKREHAIRSVMLFGPRRAAEAAPALLAELRRHSPTYPIDTSVRVNITIALGGILAGDQRVDVKQQQEAVQLLTKLLRDSQDIVRYRAAQSLGMIGYAARSALPELLQRLRDSSAWEVRQAAATAVGQIAFNPQGGPPPQVLNALYERIREDPAFQVRLAAIQSIAMAGATTDPAHRSGMIRVIEPIARKDSEPALQIWAQLALMNLTGRMLDDNIEHISKLLNKGDLLTRTQAAQAIGAVGVRAKETIPALLDGLKDPDPAVQGWIIWALGRMEDHASKAVPVLEKMAADPKTSDLIRKQAKTSIEQINKAKTGSQQ